MADGRKNNGCKKGEHRGQGRKPKADELKLVEVMDSIMSPEEVWSKIAEKASEGDIQALKLWVEYRLGKPKQQVDVTTQGESINAPEINITVASASVPFASSEDQVDA